MEFIFGSTADNANFLFNSRDSRVTGRGTEVRLFSLAHKHKHKHEHPHKQVRTQKHKHKHKKNEHVSFFLCLCLCLCSCYLQWGHTWHKHKYKHKVDFCENITNNMADRQRSQWKSWFLKRRDYTKRHIIRQAQFQGQEEKVLGFNEVGRGSKDK